MKSTFRAISLSICTFVATQSAQASFVTFETPSLGIADYKDDWRPTGGFSSDGAFLNNMYVDTPYTFWAGFSLSKASDVTTLDYTNQYAVYAPAGANGRGAGGSSQYAVGYYSSYDNFAPVITLPEGQTPVSIDIANTTYAYLTMRDGYFSATKFGGTDGNAPDFFKLTIKGLNDANVLQSSKDFYLADYRFANNALDFILSNWATVDLTSLTGDVRKLRFEFESSQGGSGNAMLTPAYVAVDNIQTVPEPTAAGLLALASLGLATRRKRA